MKNHGKLTPFYHAGLPPQRARRWVALRTLHDLRRSVAMGRPMSLPNFLRLYRRRSACCNVSTPDMQYLARLYRQWQPFRSWLEVSFK